MASIQHSASSPLSHKDFTRPSKWASVVTLSDGKVNSLATACQAQECLQTSSSTTATILAPCCIASSMIVTMDAPTPGQLAKSQLPVNAIAWMELTALHSYSQSARLADDMKVQQKLANNGMLIQQLLKAIASNSSSHGTNLLHASIAASVLSDIVYDNKLAALLLSMHADLAGALGAGLAGGVNYDSYFANKAELDTVHADYLSPESCSIINYSLRPVIRDKHTLLLSCAAVACAVAATCPDTVKLEMVNESSLMTSISKVLNCAGPLSTRHGGYWLQPWNMVPAKLQVLRLTLAQTVRHMMESKAAAQYLCRQHSELVIFAERFSSMEIPCGTQGSSLPTSHPAVKAAHRGYEAASQQNPAGIACQVIPSLLASDQPLAASSTDSSQTQEADITNDKDAHPLSTVAAIVRVHDAIDRLCCFVAADFNAAVMTGIRYIDNNSAMSELLRSLQHAAKDKADGAQLLMACSQLLSHVLQPCFVLDNRDRVPRPLQREQEIQLQLPRLSFMHVQVITGLLKGTAAHWSATTAEINGSIAGSGPALRAIMQTVCDLGSLPLYTSYKPSILASFDEYPIVVLKARIDRLAQTKRSNMDAEDKKHIDCYNVAVEEAAQPQQTLEGLMLAVESVMLLAAKSGDEYALRVMYLLVSVVKKLQKRRGPEADSAVVRGFDNVVGSYRAARSPWRAKVPWLLRVFLS